MEIGKLYLIKEDVTVYSHLDKVSYSCLFVLNKNNIVLCLKQLDHDYGYNFLYLFESKTFFLAFSILEKSIVEIFLEELK